MQIETIVVVPGRAVFTCAPDDSMRNTAGAVHGGVAYMMLDTVAGCALQTMLPTGKTFASVEMKVNCLKAILLKGGLLTATGTVVKSGSRVAFAECVMSDESGGLVATASSTLMISDIKSPWELARPGPCSVVAQGIDARLARVLRIHNTGARCSLVSASWSRLPRSGWLPRIGPHGN
jgi:uncharacterized protein (TIGR00369 family)